MEVGVQRAAEEGNDEYYMEKIRRNPFADRHTDRSIDDICPDLGIPFAK
jgi:hypothetical protein